MLTVMFAKVLASAKPLPLHAAGGTGVPLASYLNISLDMLSSSLESGNTLNVKLLCFKALWFSDL